MNKNIIIVVLLIIVSLSCTYILVSGSVLSTNNEVEEINNSDELDTEELVQSNVTTINISELDSEYTITESGEYELTGSNDDIQVIVNAPEQEVTLNLNSVTMSSQDSSAITVIDADKVYMNLIGESTISDTVNNSDSYQAPIFIDEVKTYINGDGILNLIGNYQEGLETNNDIFIESGTLNITAVDDAINAGDLLQIDGGELYTTSGGDGIDSNGDLIINGGYMEVSASTDPTREVNGAFDYNEEEGYTFELNGGVIISGGGAMGVEPTSSSQNYTFYYATGTQIQIGEYDVTLPQSFDLVFISYPDLQTTDNVIVDGTSYRPEALVPIGMQNGGGQMGGGAPR